MNLTISVSGNAGLFLELGAGGTIQNLGINNFNVATTGASNNKAGTLAAEASGRIVNCYAVDSDDVVDVSSGSAQLAISAAWWVTLIEGSIISSYATGAVDRGAGRGDFVGGLVG